MLDDAKCSGNVMNLLENIIQEKNYIKLSDILPNPPSNSVKIYVVYQYGYNYSIILKAFRKKEDAEELRNWHLKNTHRPTYIEEVELI